MGDPNGRISANDPGGALQGMGGTHQLRQTVRSIALLFEVQETLGENFGLCFDLHTEEVQQGHVVQVAHPIVHWSPLFNA